MSQEDTMRSNLRALAWAFARANNISLTTVSKKIHGHGDFLQKYFDGQGSTRIDTYFLMVNRFRARWPESVDWPETEPVGKLGKRLDEGFADAT